MTFDDWQSQVPGAITRDVLWKIKGYRLSLFLSDLCWHDATKMMSDARLVGVADQLYRACGRISACIAEGYSRGTGRDRARFYEYAVGSLREARDWYYKGRHCLAEGVLDHRFGLIEECLRLLLTMTRRDRLVKRKFEPES